MSGWGWGRGWALGEGKKEMGRKRGGGGMDMGWEVKDNGGGKEAQARGKVTYV